MSALPNILLLAVDALRLDQVGSYGNPKGLTPNIDRLAARSLRFDQAITGGTWTQAAFPTILTSTYASMFDGCLGPLSPERPSPIERLQQAGYETIAVTSNPLTGKDYGYDRGFEQFFELQPTRRDPRIRYRRGGQTLLRHPVTQRVAQLFGWDLRPRQVYVPAEALNSQALDAVDDSQSSQFLWLHYMDVHWPYHREQDLIHPTNIAQAWQDVADFHEACWGDGTLSDAQQKHFINLYEAALRHLDHQIGLLLTELEKRGWLDDALIVLLSDHGEEFFEHGRWGHMEVNFHDEVSRVPMIVHAPQWLADTGRAGELELRLVQTLDVMPTILDYCGLSKPEGMLGHSLQSAHLADAGQDEPRVVFTERWRPPKSMVAARTSISRPNCPL